MYCIQALDQEPIIQKIKTDFSASNTWIKIAYAGLCRTDVMAARGDISVPNNKYWDMNARESWRSSKVSFHKRNACCYPLEQFWHRYDGAFEYVEVPQNVVSYPRRHQFQAAFSEPVAAALGTQRHIHPSDSLIFGKGRIAALTYNILKLHGFDMCNVLRPVRNTTDFIIETNIGDTSSTIDSRGTLILVKITCFSHDTKSTHC